MSTALVPVPLSSEEQSFAWRELAGSRPQRLLHNFLVGKIGEHRDRLETAEPGDVLKSQVAIKELRAMLEELHSHDSAEIRKLYGPE